ncbi:MAG: PhoH family protein [Thermotogota bacterium]|nr:PhoH family protein [Thermotogota bacterium]
MIKNFILDTNVLVHDPECFDKFEDNNIIIPFPVLEEIDKLKSKQGSVGKNAREVNRKLDLFRNENSLVEGIKLASGGVLKVLLFEKLTSTLPEFVAEKYKDNAILRYTLELKKRTEKPVVLVTKDINLRVKADILNIDTQDYLADKVGFDEGLSGIIEITDDKMLEKFNNTGELPVSELEMIHYSNLFIDFNNQVYGKISPDGEKIVKLERTVGDSCWGIYPRNREQLFAFELLLDDRIKLVSIPGIAGSGKTLLSLAAGLRKVEDEKKYQRLIVARPLIAMGQDIGYLPGSREEKVRPWMQPIYDNLHLLLKNRNVDFSSFVKKNENLEIEVLSYIRGRSIPDQFIIIDEAQNLTPHEIKTIITRVGENTKIVLTGDPHQIDNNYLDTNSCGLVYAASRFKGSKLAGHINLVKGERSELATEAANLL